MVRIRSLTGMGAVVVLMATLLGNLEIARAQGLVIDGEVIADAATMAAAKKEGNLIIFTTMTSLSAQTILNGFKKATGIPVETIRLTTEKMYQRVLSEAAAGRLEADIVDLTDAPLVENLVAKGVLNRPHKVPAFDKINARLKDPQGRWYGLVRPISIIAVNTAVVKQADYPKSWKDVLDPKWKGRISLPSIDAGGSSFTLFAFLREEVDQKYWSRLSSQKPRIFPAVAAAATDLLRGESSIMIGGAAQLLPQIESGAPLKIIFPAEGVSSFFHGGGMTTSTKRPNAAAVYLNWMTSKSGAAVIGSAGGYAATPGAPPPSAAGLIFPAPDKVWNIDVKRWRSIRQQYTNEWHAAMEKGN